MKFRKKPVVIEAVQFKMTDECTAELKTFLGANAGRRYSVGGGPWELEIVTLEDGNVLKAKHIATEGDWIIKGVQGEFYACKPDIFELTYEVAE